MQKIQIKLSFAIVAALVFVVAAFTACDNNTPDPNLQSTVYGDFQLIFSNGSGNPSGTLVQGVKDVSKGEINFVGRGFEMTSSRVARVFISDDGSTLYSLNYTQGTVDKLIYNGGQNYTKIKTIDASIPLGTKYLRLTKLTDKEASLHYIDATAQFDPTDNTKYLKHKMVLTLGLLNLDNMEIKDGFQKELEFDLPGDLGTQGYYIYRIDAPVISGNKLYYGTAVRKYDPTVARKYVDTDRAFTLVIDYPSLTNPIVIENTSVKGSSHGYRTPTQHRNEAGEILQMISLATGEVSILKIVNGQYTSYKYSLNELLGKKVTSNGWFYAGNGIGYIPYQDLTTEKIQIGVNPQGEPTYSGWWKIARMNFNNNTVVDLEVPDGLWLEQYQASTIRNGKFYIALSPEATGQGNIYIFDVNSTNPKGSIGATIKTGADQRYIGIY